MWNVFRKRDMPLINIGRFAKSIRTTWSWAFFSRCFLKEIGCESFKDVTIRTEMPVLRILTAGSGPRRIDICIMNNHNKNVVIIENKLNNAQEQQCQLADYKAGLKHNGFNVVKTVCLQGSNLNDIGADIDLSIMHLASLLDKVCGNCFELKSYIALLKNMGRKERMKEEVEKLLSLNNDTKDNPFAKVRDISRLFYNDEVSEYCFNEIRSSLENMNKDFLELIFKEKIPDTLIMKDAHFCRYGTNMAIKRSKFWLLDRTVVLRL